MASLVWSIAYAVWEDRLVDRMVETATADVRDSPDEARAIAIMDFVHAMLKPRLDLLGPTGPVRPRALSSTDSLLLVPDGYCGSFAHVLARCLQRAGFDVRIAQMLSRGIWGDHIVVEAMIDGRWVVLDAFYNLAFKGSDGHLLSFREVGDSWDSIRGQCPPRYNHHYRYEDVRYTNWRGLPIDILGSWTREVSIRTWVLNRYWPISVCLALALLIVIIAHAWRRHPGNPPAHDLPPRLRG